MKSYTYGTLPDLSDFPDEPFPMKLTTDDALLFIEVCEQGIDSHLEAIFYEQRYPEARKLDVTIRDGKSLRTFVRRLIEKYEADEDSDSAGDFASAILETIGIEWV